MWLFFSKMKNCCDLILFFISSRSFYRKTENKSAHDVLKMVVVEIKFMAIMRKTFGRLGYFKL